MSESQSPALISEFVRQSTHLASAGRTSCFSERIGESWTVGWVLVLSLPCVALFASFTSLNSHFLSIQWRWQNLPLRFLSRIHEVIDVGFFLGGEEGSYPPYTWDDDKLCLLLPLPQIQPSRLCGNTQSRLSHARGWVLLTLPQDAPAKWPGIPRVLQTTSS